MNEYEIRVEDEPSPDDVQTLFRSLYEFNVAQTGQTARSICVFLRDSEEKIVGGAHGWMALGWLHIHVLWLRDDIRRKGFGRQVLEATEAEAKKRGCRFAELETFSFQSLEFYLKNGYTVFAELDQVAGNHRWYFLKKTLA